MPFFFFCFYRVNAQSLPEQDCTGAIPLCQNIYTTTIAYNGTGNIPNEINPTKSCLSSGEKNDAWYIFTAQTSGDVGFLITPFNGQDDYDWAVFNITNKTCGQIFSDATMEVSCNYDANIGCGGVTGPNGTLSPCGQTEARIPVAAGQTYVVNVSNYSSSQNGYTIDFSSSSAFIYDNQPPQQVSLNVSCSDKNITLHFNEPIDCRTISNSNDDFVLADENGTYKSIPSISGSGCSSASYYTSEINLSFQSPLAGSSEYYIIAKPGADGNSVSDKCNNFFLLNDTVAVITPQNDLFVNLGADILFCPEDVNAPLLQLPSSGDATYTWALGGQALAGSTHELTVTATGVYTGTISYGSLCSTSDTITANYFQSLIVSAGNDSTVCNGQQLPLLSSNIAGGTYAWALNGTNLSSAHTFQPSQPGTYTLTVTKQGFCRGVDTVLLSAIAPPQIDLGSDIGICNGDTVQLQISGQFSFYEWYLNNTIVSANSSVNNITQPGNYILKTGINSTCFDLDTVSVFQKALTPISLGNDRVSCLYDSLPVIEAVTPANDLNWYYNKTPLTATGPVIQTLGPGRYIAVATANNYCLNSDTVKLTLSDVLPVSFGEDKITCETNTIRLETHIYSPGIFEWKRNGDHLNSNNNALDIDQSGEYVFNFSGNSGCTASDTVSIEIRKQLKEPVVSCPLTTNGKKVFSWNNIIGAAAYTISENMGLSWLQPTVNTTYEANITVNQLWVRAVGDSVCTAGKTGISTGCEVLVPTIIVSTVNNIFSIEGAESPFQVFITDASGRNIFFEGDYKNNYSLTGLSTGMYLYKIKSGKAQYQTGKFVLMK